MKNKKLVLILVTMLILCNTIFPFADTKIIYDSRNIIECLTDKAIISERTNLYKDKSLKNKTEQIEANELVTILNYTTINEKEYVYIKTNDIKGYIEKDKLIEDYSKQTLSLNYGYIWATAKEGTLLYKDKELTIPVYYLELNNDITKENYKTQNLLVETNNILYIQKDETAVVNEINGDTANITLSTGDSGYISLENVSLTADNNNEFVIDPENIRNAIIKTALQYEGGKYIWGGTDLENGVDCSGFIMKIFETYGIKTERTANAQYESSKEISAEELKPGDVIYYNRDGKIGHVALYIGNELIIHAKNSKEGIVIDEINYNIPQGYATYF